MEDQLTALRKCIPALGAGERFILGIDGLSRSGKTTLVRELSRALQQEQGTPV